MQDCRCKCHRFFEPITEHSLNLCHSRSTGLAACRNVCTARASTTAINDPKVATLALRRFESSLPPYLSELLYTYQPSRTLRSSSEKLFKIPQTNLKSAGNRSFYFQAAKIWNSLPTNVRSSPSLSSFKTILKTRLFKERFSLGL